MLIENQKHMRLQTKIALFAVAVTGLGWLTPLPVRAATGEVLNKSIVVNFADLDLSRPEGAHTLYRRIQGAAREVCSTESDGVRTLRPLQTFKACYQKAVEDAVNQVNRPALTALHRAATPDKRVG